MKSIVLLVGWLACCAYGQRDPTQGEVVAANGTKRAVTARTQREGVECSLPKVSGSCGQNITRYYYDSSAGKCKSFIYTGCGGNLNNFDHEDDCNLRCVCSRPKEPGNGQGVITRFFYNTASKLCEGFRYRGSGGNVNNFLTTTECQNVCEPYKRRCKSRPEFGKKCKQPSSSRYYYDINCDCCRPFTYLGCDGGRNMFSSESNCLKKCSEPQVTPKPPKERPEFCYFQAVSGNCDQIFTRYYYSYEKKRCLPFTYTGCGGNANNFIKFNECQRSCNAKRFISDSESPATPQPTTSSPLPAMCVEEPSRGHCQFNLNRFYFDKRDGSCKPFMWSGCGGSSNRFISRYQCQDSCKRL